MNEQVVLVDKDDNQTGLMDKLEAHRGKGKLHRAVSVLLYRKNNGNTEVFLQQRSKYKSLWPLFWSNTVCTHPRDGESYVNCAVRRLKEEMGISLEPQVLTYINKFIYQAQFSHQLSEYELDGVVVGEWNKEVLPDTNEVAAYKWQNLNQLTQDLISRPQQFTPWFLDIMNNKLVIRELGN